MLHACMIVLVEICSMPSILVVLSAYNEASHMHGLCGSGVNGVDGVDEAGDAGEERRHPLRLDLGRGRVNEQRLCRGDDPKAARRGRPRGRRRRS